MGREAELNDRLTWTGYSSADRLEQEHNSNEEEER